MRYRVDEPIFTTVLPAVDAFRPLAGSLYITGESPEQRSTHTGTWQSRCPDVTFLLVTTNDSATMSVDLAGISTTINLRSAASVRALLDQGAHSAIYLDITGLPHHVWAPLLRAIRSRAEPSFAVYVEPGDYRFSASPTDVTLFDLSEKIDGISPLPGFVTLATRRDDEGIFVPLLGFEGARFAYMLEAVQPKRENICPVIGVPGFRPEYPFYSYLGNRLQLSETRAWHNVRFASANCPFSLYHVLAAVADESENKYLKIGLIGTKPHALGAILYYLDRPNSTELLYDYPIRKAQRTTGVSRVCLYDLSLLPPYRPDRSPSTGPSHT
jgi:hypothetical protein